MHDKLAPLIGNQWVLQSVVPRLGVPGLEEGFYSSGSNRNPPMPVQPPPPLRDALRCAQEGYAVIFLTRDGSQQPFSHLLPSSDPVQLVDRIAATGAAGRRPGGDHDDEAASEAGVHIRPERVESVLRLLNALQACRRDATLLTIPYKTVFEYIRVGY